MMNDRNMPQMTRVEVSLGALADNFRELRRVTSKSAGMMAVVKADAYGHGAVQVSKVALKNGADFLAVARIGEAVELRDAGIQAPILLFGFCHPDFVLYLSEQDIRASVNTLEAAQMLSRKAGQLGVQLKVHIKVDTGMGRLGIVSDGLLGTGESNREINQAAETILAIESLPHLDIEGIYTHFASSDSFDKSYARFQMALFSDLLATLERQSLSIPIRHAANSAATIEMPETHLDMVRPGISQYGLWPSGEVNREKIELKPAMSIKSRIIQVKEVPAGFKVSYGSTYETPERTTIATVPVGYADGYARILSSRGTMLVHGRRVPVIGRVCMDLTMIDVGQLDAVQLNDEVVILGRQGNAEISADEIATLVNTINYEVVSSLTCRMKKFYSA